MDRDREAFEAHIHARTVWNLCRHEDDPATYEHPKVQEAWSFWQAALAYVRETQKPVGWFNPWNDVHGYQQVAEEFEGDPGTIPLYAAPPLNVSPPEKE